jgi:hypothetical protein
VGSAPFREYPLPQWLNLAVKYYKKAPLVVKPAAFLFLVFLIPTDTWNAIKVFLVI